MTAFSHIALVRSHQRTPTLTSTYISDLTELCTLAAHVQEEVERITIPVGPVDRDPLAGFQRYLRKNRPDLVGISSFTCGVESAMEYARLASEQGAFVVMGGYHPSAMAAELLVSPHVDAVVRGEGENTFRELVRNGPSREVLGLSWQEGGETLHNPDRPLIDDLDALPLPLREIRPERFGLDGLHYHTDTVFTSRGCKAKCVFCANNLVGKNWRQRSAENVLEELLTLRPGKRKRSKTIKLWDANFMTDVDRIDRLCDLILEHGLEKIFRFQAETRVEDIIRGRPILGKMARAGIAQLTIGVESPHSETQKTLKKGINLNSMEGAAELLRENGIHLVKSFIIGHPNEGVEQVKSYADYALDLGVENQSCLFNVMTPYPGTGTFDQLKAEGLIQSFDWSLYNNFCTVVKARTIDRRPLHALLTGTSAKYSALKHFRRSESYGKVAFALIKKVFYYTLASGLARDNDRLANEENMRMALDYGVFEERRPGGSREGWFDRCILVFHPRQGEPTALRFDRIGGEEVVRLQPAREALAERGGKRLIHVSLPRLYQMMASINSRKVGSDALTFSHGGIRHRLTRGPLLLVTLLRLLFSVIGMAGSHVMWLVKWR